MYAEKVSSLAEDVNELTNVVKAEPTYVDNGEQDEDNDQQTFSDDPIAHEGF